MSDSEKLRALADWFDKYDAGFVYRTKVHGDNGEVQADLRRIAKRIETDDSVCAIIEDFVSAKV